MLVTWKYRPRDTFFQRLDPRTRFIYLACVIIALTIPEIWDYRIILPLFLISLTLYMTARIEWKVIRRTWIYILILLFFIVGLNALLSGRGGPSSVTNVESPVVFVVPVIGVSVTVSKIWFAINQIIRMLTMAIPAILIPYTTDPNVFGTAFRRMGISDKVAFTMDLAFRFIPTFAHDLTVTMDAQRARGYEMDKLKGGVAARIQRLAPLIIPVVMQSTVTGEEVIDAMDLRAFGTRPRTWLKELHYAPRDYFMIGLGVGIFVLCCILKWGFGVGGYFVPDWFAQFFV
ncbi:MAG: energy-coupling factor transporter transmembrane protein EcfT [Chloroflexota bacterium]|nr:energy-coupling factor transporter transmembrane protein EcfT [Chloroflexota bacterium]